MRVRRFSRNIVSRAAAAGLSAALIGGTAAGAHTPSVRARQAGAAAPLPIERFRSDVSLNGQWRFAPAAASTMANPPLAPGENDPVWGAMKVPGSWMRPDDVLRQGSGSLWSDFAHKDTLGRETVAGWYETTITVPETAKGRRVLLDFARISTDAIVYVGETRCGEVNWPEGQVDITRAVVWGKPLRLRVYVVSTADKDDVKILMGILPGQNSTRKAERESAGLIGSVTLQTRPDKACIDDIFVQTSTRKKELGIVVSLHGGATGSANPGANPVEITACAVNEQGIVEKTFAPVRVTPLADGSDGATVAASWKWENPRLWDLEQPHVYTLQVTVKGAGIDDGIAQSFGFREFWVDGRTLFLNGTPFRMRPTLLNTDVPGGWEEARSLGFNLVELWPNGHERRTQESRYVDWYDYADTHGIPLTGILPHMDWMGGNYSTPERAAALETQIRRDLRRYRNHPSIIMWGTSGNMMGATGDPHLAGLREKSRAYDMARSPNLREAFPIAQRGITFMKGQDPTRPVFIHFGGAIGDLYTLNHYLNFTPLQEREEFISDWAKYGDMPLWYVEFGTPLNTDLFRGRNGFGNAMQTEPFLSEYCAIYQGTEAYRQEPSAYRADLVSKFLGDQKYQGWFYNDPINTSASFQALQRLFLTNTWRSYRTWGMTGGMIPWDGGYVTIGGKRTPAGDAFAVANAPTLAWIAGEKAAFTAKDHHYRGGQMLRKQIALLNDSRTPQNFVTHWIVRRDNGMVLGEGTKSGTLAVGETRFVPLEVRLKEPGVGKVAAQIVMEARIGDKVHRDTFAFHLFGTPAPLAPADRPVTIYDPVGKTSAMLAALGYRLSPWRGDRSTPKSGMVIVGRGAFERNGSLSPSAFASFVQQGGRLLIFSPTPAYLRKQWGFRVAAHAARRVWPIPSPTVTRWFSAWESSDLRDWSGTSSLLEAYPDYVKGGTEDTKLAPTEMPYHGYRWGTRGSVCSAPVEKPHLGGWKPVFEGEFDLAYAPLLSRDYGAGKVTLCTFDLEDHVAADPVVGLLTRQIIQYARRAPVVPRAAAVSYCGDAHGTTLLDSLGLRYTRVIKDSPPIGGKDRLLIVGEESDLRSEAIRAFARSGGRVLFLARQSTEADPSSGLTLQRSPGFHGSLSVPSWPECDGLSASDLRFRASTNWVVCASSNRAVAVGADGLLARETVGTGIILSCQIDPEWLDAGKRTYFRETRWRQMRALTQILANLGGTFRTDGWFFRAASCKSQPFVTPLYDSDHRSDFDLGDDPYRSFNW